jgi:hypothetical protein
MEPPHERYRARRRQRKLSPETERALQRLVPCEDLRVLETETMTTFAKLRRQDWEVRDAPLAAAQALVKEFHYSKGGSNTAVYVHGLYNKATGALHGVAWWLPPTKVACQSVNKEAWTKVLALTRLVLTPNTPKNAASYLLGASVKMIRKGGRFMSLVTYADESQGHTGGIYKASNWVYVGKTGPYPRWVTLEGRQVAAKATVNRTKAQMEALGHKKVGSFFKHKFVLHLIGKPNGT